MQLETTAAITTSEITERLVRVILDYLVSGEIKIDLHFSDKITTNEVTAANTVTFNGTGLTGTLTAIVKRYV